jgi:hypothetical protein
MMVGGGNALYNRNTSRDSMSSSWGQASVF